MMGKLPSIQFYPGDWLRDTVAGCSLSAQGLWLRMMFLMHDSDRYGYLSCNGVAIPPEAITRRCSCDSLGQYTSLLTELFDAGVPSKTQEGVIFCRRMVQDAKDRAANAGRQAQYRKKDSNGDVTAMSRACHGSSNGDVTPHVTPMSHGSSSSTSSSTSSSKTGGGRAPPSSRGFPSAVDDAIAQCALESMPKEFVMVCYDKALSRGGKDSREIPIENFPAYCRTEFKYEKSRKNEPGAGNGVSTTGQSILNQKELDRVEARMKKIKDGYSEHQSWEQRDQKEFNELRSRKNELVKQLGFKV